MHNAILFTCNALGVHYIIALLFSVLILAPIGYALHSFYTFERDMEPIRFMRFTGGLIAAFPLNLALMMVLVSGIGLGVPLATLLCTGLLFLWNYLSARWAILLRRDRRASPASKDG